MTQLINTPTRPNPKCPEKSSLIDLILTNVPFKYTVIGVFANDVSDHCVIAAVRDTKVPKSAPRTVERQNMKMFVEQGFLYDLFYFDWTRIAMIDDVELALTFFQNSFLDILNRHAPILKFRIKGRDNPWFTPVKKCSLGKSKEFGY